MAVSVETYQQLVLEDREGHWELVCGRLRQKPPMTTEHNQAARMLGRLLDRQLDPNRYVVDTGTTRLQLPSGSFYEPDVCVIPLTAVRRLRERPGTFEVYEEPMPLVVEVWSPSTGNYDVGQKLRDYQARGDREIWRLHPVEQSLTRWLREPDGSYRMEQVSAGAVQPAALPGVRIVLAEIFA